LFGILRGIDPYQGGKRVVSCYPVSPLKSMRSPPTFTILEGFVPVKGLDRRLIGKVNYTPHIPIDGVSCRFLAPEVLEGNFAFEVGISLTPGVGDIAF